MSKLDVIGTRQPNGNILPRDSRSEKCPEFAPHLVAFSLPCCASELHCSIGDDKKKCCDDAYECQNNATSLATSVKLTTKIKLDVFKISSYNNRDILKNIEEKID